MSLPAPVIFLPGITGSSLRDEYPVNPESVWSVMKAAVKSYDRITLHPDDPRFEVAQPARVVRDQVFDMFYGECIEELRHNLTQDSTQPVPVYPFAYDWRQSLEDTQEQLKAFIEEVIARTSLMRHYHHDTPAYTAKSGKVNLVGHSMGGLVIAGYLAKHGGAKVDKVATLASPFRGSIEAIVKTSMGTGGFSLFGGGSREREAARVTPALYHLLPSFTGAVTPKQKDIFEPSNWQPGIRATLQTFIDRHSLVDTNVDALLGSMLKKAEDHRDAMEGLQLSDPKRWLCVVGVGAETRLNFKIGADENGAPYFEIPEPKNSWKASAPSTSTGDGTVPYQGARCSFVPKEQVVCVSTNDLDAFEFGDQLLAKLGFHAAIPSMNLVQRLVVAHLSGNAPRKLAARPAPEVKVSSWDPPIAGLDTLD